MEAIAQHLREFQFFKFGIGDRRKCIDWAIERLQKDQERNDLEIVLLAAATEKEEIQPLLHTIITRYCGVDALDDQLAVGKYVAWLRQEYLLGRETIKSLDEKLSRLYYPLGYPDWLIMLTRNCEYATDIPGFEEPFEQEFAYIADLWDAVSTRAEFERRYSRAVSNQHDVKFN
jgi:hypothetical protein